MQRENKGRARDRLLLKHAWCLRRSSTTNCAAWSCEPPGAKNPRGKYQIQVFSQGHARVPPFLGKLGQHDRIAVARRVSFMREKPPGHPEYQKSRVTSDP